MATKTQKKTENVSEKITSFYMNYVLTEQKQPASVYAFTKDMNITEAEFYKHFATFRDIDVVIWKNAAENTINSLMASKEFRTYNTREKILGFYYTLIEALNAHRSYFEHSVKSSHILNNTLKEFREQIVNFAKMAIQQGLAEKELQERKFLSDRYHEAVWMNTLFILNFWARDYSKGSEKTDAAIEKSVNLMLELMGKSALDSVLDLGKFLFQNGIKR